MYHCVGRVREESFREGVEESWREVVYDPVHLVMSLKHFFYYDDVQRLVRTSLGAVNVEEGDYRVDEVIQTESEFRRRKVEALCLALAEGYH